ncbi:MAG: hypothetical protein ACKVOK_13315 [Flavobacteriales bacterium]
MKNKIFLFLFIAVSVNLSAQFDPGFIRHVSNLGLKVEHKAYIESKDPIHARDSTHYYLGKFHFQYQQDSLFLDEWFKAKTLFTQDTGFISLACIHFLDARNDARDMWFGQALDIRQCGAAKACFGIYSLGLDPFDTSYSYLPMDDRMKSSLLRYQKIVDRRPWKAAILSAVVPGMGKVYAGRSKAGILGLVGTLMFGVQAWESYRKLGVQHPLSIINISILGLFYGANIFGGAMEVKRVRLERKNQFYKYASRYYHSYYKCRLY